MGAPEWEEIKKLLEKQDKEVSFLKQCEDKGVFTAIGIFYLVIFGALLLLGGFGIINI